VSDKPGDDDEGYIFLAYQVLRFFDAPPVWTFRAPGLPLAIAGLLDAAGRDRIWIVGLYHRLLLAAIPPVVFLALARFLRPGVAAAVALLGLAMGYNDRLATFALTDLSYASLSLFAVLALLKALDHRRPLPWLVLAGGLLAAKTLVRVTGIAVAAGVAVTILLISTGPWSRRAARATVVIGPSLAVLLVVSAYNGVVAGRFRPSMGGSLQFLLSVGPYLGHTPDTPAIRELASLVPEVPARYFLQAAIAPWVAHYRFTANGRGDSFDFGAGGDRAAFEVLSSMPREYAWIAMKTLLIGLVVPTPQWVPARWTEIPWDWYRPRIENPAVCGLQHSLGAAVDAATCAQNARLRASLGFQPEWLAARPAVSRLAHGVVRGIRDPLRRWIWPLYWGVGAFAALASLLARGPTRAVALLILVPIAIDFAFASLVVLSIGGRFHVHVHMLYLLAVGLGLAATLDGLAGTVVTRVPSAVGSHAVHGRTDTVDAR
jgi:hypothetical protein